TAWAICCGDGWGDRPPGGGRNRLSRPDRGVPCRCPQVGTDRRPRLGRVLRDNRYLLSRCLRRNRLRSRQSRDQHRFHRCSRARLDLDHGSVCPGVDQKGVILTPPIPTCQTLSTIFGAQLLTSRSVIGAVITFAVFGHPHLQLTMSASETGRAALQDGPGPRAYVPRLL